jgi:hypothetical protein
VQRIAERHFRLDPYPYSQDSISFTFPARHLEGKTFSSAKNLEAAFFAATPTLLQVTISR